MRLEHEIVSVYRNLLFQLMSFLQKTPIEELLEPKINTGTFHVYHVTPSTLCCPTPCHPAPLWERPPCSRFSSIQLKKLVLKCTAFYPPPKELNGKQKHVHIRKVKDSFLCKTPCHTQTPNTYKKQSYLLQKEIMPLHFYECYNLLASILK
jgi:hypothetical protein